MKLTVTLHIGGKQVDTLTDEVLEKMSARLTESMSLYYTAHPEEYKEMRKEKCLISKKKTASTALL